MKAKLKKFDGLDIDHIRMKDFELKSKMENGETMNSPNLNFDFDPNTANIKVNEEPIALKNATQKNFLETYDKN